jgi:hypothetical protein
METKQGNGKQYAINIMWSDGEETGVDEFLSIEKTARMILREVSEIGVGEEYPDNVYITQVIISVVDD